MAKFCSNCGKQLSDGAKFCPSCGTPQGAAIQQARQPVPQPPAQQAAHPATQPQQPVRQGGPSAPQAQPSMQAQRPVTPQPPAQPAGHPVAQPQQPAWQVGQPVTPPQPVQPAAQPAARPQPAAGVEMEHGAPITGVYPPRPGIVSSYERPFGASYGGAAPIRGSYRV